MSRALREKLRELELQRDQAQQRAAETSAPSSEVTLDVIERWKELVAEMENIGARVDGESRATDEEIAEARERLAGLIDPVKIVPENGKLVAEIGLRSLELGSYIRVVAGARFGNCLLTLPRRRITRW